MNGKTVLTHTLDALSKSGLIDEIALVLSESDLEAYEEIKLWEGACSLVKAVAPGGNTRQESVYSGLNALSEKTDIVLIHDGARPFVTEEIIKNVISDAAQSQFIRLDFSRRCPLPKPRSRRRFAGYIRRYARPHPASPPRNTGPIPSCSSW